MPGELRFTGKPLFVLARSQQRGIASLGRLFLPSIVIGGIQIGIACHVEMLCLEEQIAEQKAALRRLRIIGEVRERQPVPAGGPFIVGRQMLAALGKRVVVLRQVAQVQFQLRDKLRIVIDATVLPERCIETVGRNVFLLGLKHELRNLPRV